MKMTSLLLAAILACQCPDESHGGYNPDLPIVEEECTAVIFVQRQDSILLYFVRPNDNTKRPEIYASRFFYNFQPEDFIITHNENGFSIEWLDHWTANRVVHFTQMALVDEEAFDMSEKEEIPWWGMQRKMVDLKQAP